MLTASTKYKKRKEKKRKGEEREREREGKGFKRLESSAAVELDSTQTKLN